MYRQDNNSVLGHRELKCAEPMFAYSSSVVAVSEDGEESEIDTTQNDKKVTFDKNLEYWQRETNVLSVNNLDNSYFKGIVDMGKDAVPFIYQEIKKRPSHLVCALDLILPGVMKYDGYVGIKVACEKWITILEATGKFS